MHIQGVPDVVQGYNSNSMLFDTASLRDFWDTLYISDPLLESFLLRESGWEISGDFKIVSK